MTEMSIEEYKRKDSRWRSMSNKIFISIFVVDPYLYLFTLNIVGWDLQYMDLIGDDS